MNFAFINIKEKNYIENNEVLKLKNNNSRLREQE